MAWTHNLHRLQAHTWGERWLLLQAVAWLGALRAAILLLPFRWITRLLGLAPGEHPAAVDQVHAGQAERIGWAVRAAARRTPWQSACLVQALVGALLLRRHGLPGTLYLGVASEGGTAGAFAAHAWLRCGEKILTGAAGRERFAAVAALSLSHHASPVPRTMEMTEGGRDARDPGGDVATRHSPRATHTFGCSDARSIPPTR